LLNYFTVRLNIYDECLLGPTIRQSWKESQWFYHCDRGYVWSCLESLGEKTKLQVSSWNA